MDWLERQVDVKERSTSQDSIKLLKKDSILNSLKSISPELMEDIGSLYYDCHDCSNIVFPRNVSSSEDDTRKERRIH